MKNKFIKSLVILLCISIVICGFTSSITVAKENGNILTNQDVEKIKLNEVTNLNNVLKSLKLSKKNIIENNYKIKREKVGFINAKGKDGKYYNFYLEGNDIKYYSVQYVKENKNAMFVLYDVNKNFILSSEVNQKGEIVEEKSIDDKPTYYRSANVNKAALRWACVFSSYTACVGVALGAGAAGSLVSGPFGAAAGFAGGFACRYVFQTAVEKYGGKDAACKIITK